MHKKNVIAMRGVAKMLVAVSSVYISQAVLAEEPIKPSWNISGWVNESMSYYDDGEGSDMVQLSDNGTTLGSRITFSGSAELTTGLNAGFDVTIEPFSGNPNFTGAGNQITPLVFSNQENLDTFNGGDIGLLGTSVYFGGDWGKVTVGLQSMPTDNIGVMADPSMTLWSGVGAMFRGSGFFLRGAEGSGLLAGGSTWGSFIQCLTSNGLGIGIDCNGVYRNGIRYDLPAFGPVSIAVGYANDDIYDIAAKYSDRLGGLDVKFHIGYAYNADGGQNVAETTTIAGPDVDTGMTAGGNPVLAPSSTTIVGDTETEMLTMQVGVMDPETGLFGTFTWQHEEADGDVDERNEDETDAYYTKLGIRKAFNKLGDTAFYVEYGQYNDQYGNMGTVGVTGSEVTRTGAAIEQYFGSKVIVYAKYEQLDLDVDGSTSIEAIYDDIDELNLFSLGVTYFF
jgi:Gram-negative porin